MDIKQTLRLLTSQTGVSGDEGSASEIAAELLREYASDVSTDPFGNVTGTIKCGVENAKTLMLDAHIDQIGMLVSYIDDRGFLKVGACGGLDMRTMLAQSVTVHGSEKVQGVICTLPPHVSSDHSKVPEVGELAIDIGMTKAQAEEVIALGDRVTVNSCFRDLGRFISAPSVDDRGGVCVILRALDILKERNSAYDIAVCFSAQEETGERGVKQATFRLEPDEAIIVDVSFGRTPDSSAHETAELGSGAMIGVSAVLDKPMTSAMQTIAASADIPYTIEVMPSSTGTNADAVSVSRSGVKCSTISIPIRYMHTPIETVDISDIEAAAQLIAAYAGGDVRCTTD